ncbi:MAG: hypothetical protein HW388_1374 [Dehalococcoidia bacterium]|nr:hypothetical protein [Dehalococcoidia bacterium]
MVDEGEDSAQESLLGGRILEALQQVLVAQVDTVEDPDGKDGVSLRRLGRQLLVDAHRERS